MPDRDAAFTINMALCCTCPCMAVYWRRCVAVCCGLMQSVAACFDVWQCEHMRVCERRVDNDAVCCGVLHGYLLEQQCYSVLQCGAVCCSVLQCVAVCCSVSMQEYMREESGLCCSMLQCFAVWHVCLLRQVVLQHVAACRRILQYVAVWYSMSVWEFPRGE